jgi:hypothetical protein
VSGGRMRARGQAGHVARRVGARRGQAGLRHTGLGRAGRGHAGPGMRPRRTWVRRLASPASRRTRRPGWLAISRRQAPQTPQGGVGATPVSLASAAAQASGSLGGKGNFTHPLMWGKLPLPPLFGLGCGAGRHRRGAVRRPTQRDEVGSRARHGAGRGAVVRTGPGGAAGASGAADRLGVMVAPAGVTGWAGGGHKRAGGGHKGAQDARDHTARESTRVKLCGHFQRTLRWSGCCQDVLGMHIGWTYTK